MTRSIFRNRYSIIVTLTCLYVLVGIIMRIAILLSISQPGISITEGAAMFLIGLFFDLAIASFIIIPFVLHIWLQNNFIYTRKGLLLTCLLFAGWLSIILFTSLIPKDYSPALYKAFVAYLLFRFLIYLLLYLLPQSFRQRWRKGVLYCSYVLVVFLLLFNAISEWFFWQEFFSRYNFIAVDYLVYTNEVLGNIKESYPIAFITGLLLLMSVLIVVATRRTVIYSVIQPLKFARRSVIAVVLLSVPLLVATVVKERWRHFTSNEYANSLAGNGLFEFAIAFQQNNLDFYKYYQTLPDTTAFRLLKEDLQLPGTRYTSNDAFSIEREISYPAPEKKLNVVLISVESLSADFMQAFGNTKNITPFLDSLATQSLFFTNLYASGTRTVRGLEALALSIPPTPGQSIVKRPANGGLFSMGSVFRSKGYTTQYLYGGYSYFDNMKTFFGGNGYTVIDRSAIPASKMHYQNIWGVADEDLFTLALETMDKNAAAHKPFFTQVMTVSNHRPYTYPDGRIDIPSSAQSRSGAVKYTDYAIHNFLLQARTKPWFDSTIFVIVADHCAGIAGKVELPVTAYHIPMLIYAPALLAPQKITQLTAQIDIAPTILGLLNMNYRSKFFGQDILNLPPEKQRAFISTYQGLGFIKNNQLVIQSPIKRIQQFSPDFSTGLAVPTAATDSLTKLAIAYYQCASFLVSHKKQGQ